MDIDGVFAGGGLRAFAYIGVLDSLEEHGYVLNRVAGTSAGAIIAAFVAAGYTKEEIKNLLEELTLTSLLDPPWLVKYLPLSKWLFLYKQLGLYYGNTFEQWLKEKLAAKKVHTFADISPNACKVIVSDISKGRLIVLPDDLEEVYGVSRATFSVARAIRMSAGYPYFFMPKELKGKKGEESIIVDGGLLSNFPLWIFDKDRSKRKRPVVGVKLSGALTNEKPKKITNALDMFQALFSTMLHAHDDRYISKTKQHHIIFIPTATDETLNFSMTEDEKKALIAIGYKKTNAFLAHWPQ